WGRDAGGGGGAAALVAVVATAIVPVALLLMRERPEDVGLLPLGATEPTPPPPPPTENPFKRPITVLREAAHVRDFWLLAGTFFVCGWTTNGAVQSHFIPAAHDHHIPQVT